MLHGHAWTIGRHLLRGVRARPKPAARFALRVPDARFGAVELGGLASELPGAQEIVIIVHGLGGNGQSPYVVELGRRAMAMGMSVLRADLRGADLSGEDLFHAGLGSDLDRVLRAPLVQAYQRRYLVGYSLGGHLCLRYAADHPDGSASAVASLCAPLDLEASAAHFDRAPRLPYRKHVLDALVRMYRAFVARRGPWPLSGAEATRLTRIRDFDEAIIAPRHGFEDAGDYYFRSSVAHVLGRIRHPSLLVQTRHDPMVPRACVAPYYGSLPASATALELDRGGHVAFPEKADLGQPGPLGLEAQVLTWLRRNGEND